MTRLIRNANGFLIGFTLITLLAFCGEARGATTDECMAEVEKLRKRIEALEYTARQVAKNHALVEQRNEQSAVYAQQLIEQLQQVEERPDEH